MSRRRFLRAPAVALVGAMLLGACGGAKPEPRGAQAPRPSILLVTLDTTRADAIGPEAAGVETPAFDALAARGRRFRQAYATAPETLPSHSSMLTGLYPAGHGVHENARPLSGGQATLAERLKRAGYRTAAVVSTFVLARRFGLARGFDAYDDAQPAGRAERTAREATDAALARLGGERAPLFLWVHYYDPHAPYTPPEPFASRYAKSPYLGEVAAMDQELGRLAAAFERQAGGPAAIVIAADHGEGLGDHGEPQHGNLLYQSTMRVPLLLVGPGVAPGVTDTPASTRRVFHTILDFAGLGSDGSLRGPVAELVLGEAMKPFLSYGWQPQVMAVEGRHKAIQAGRRIEVYDVLADPAERRDMAPATAPSREARTALREYPLPSLAATPAPEALGDAERRQLASLGYVSAGAAPVVREDAPRPVDMAGLFDVLEKASGLFVREEYARVIPLLDAILARDPGNLDAALRLATAHSSLGHEAKAEAAFERAGAIAPQSPDVRMYLALHYTRTRGWERAVPLLERIVAETPDRLPALEALAVIRQRQERTLEALVLREKIYALRPPSPLELVRLGELAMHHRRTELALSSFEKARELQAGAFEHDLELGALYLAARRFEDARAALDRVPPAHPGYAMALFKRAQVSVLLSEPDRVARIEAARRRADATTRTLIENERLFQGTRTP